MSLQKIENVRIAAISAAVPAHTVQTSGHPAFSGEEEALKYMENVGVRQRHINQSSLCCSDFCMAAAEKCLSSAGWEKETVDLMVFVSQYPDYVLPATACVLHGKMGMPVNCTAFDISLGCSGWAYGMAVVAGLVQSGAFKRALLMVGDALPNGERDKGKPLFGDAGTATLLEYDQAAAPIYIETCTQGADYEAIIRRGGASRHPFDARSLEVIEDRFGERHTILDEEMDGPAVFIFGITQVPRAVKRMLQTTGNTVDSTDYVIFHQANLMMTEQIRKKCKIPAEKCPISIDEFGNNSSASIPLTIVTRLRDQAESRELKILACGFGVGLSWGTVSTTLQRPVVPELILL